MKIVVIIPSLSEEDSISHLVRVIDRGLLKYYPNSKSLILNVDSDSQDRTVEIFTNTSTKFPKHSIVNKSVPRGKGSNILKAICHFPGTDYFVTLDADLISARRSWIQKFMNPLINAGAGLVAPIYTRNRYEGNTTNHFSSPIVYACLNRDVVQPLAGDFGFTKELARDVCRNVAIPSDQMYGIDTIITWVAILNNYKITQVKLGRKIHKPSFPKIAPMFEQIATTTFRLVNQNRHRIVQSLHIKIKKPEKYNIVDDRFIQTPKEDKIREIKKLAVTRLNKYRPPGFIENRYYQKNHVLAKEWAEILSGYLCYLLKNKLNFKQLEGLAQSIVGLYLLRVLNYFNEISDPTARNMDDILFKQKLLLRKCLTNKFYKISH